MSGSFSYSPDKGFNVGAAEKKMDMSLDDIIEMNKPRIPNKGMGRNIPNGEHRSMLQRNAAARSSMLRQGKLAEVRAGHNGEGKFAFQKPQGWRALTGPVQGKLRRWTRNNEFGRRGGFQKRQMVPNMNFSQNNQGSYGGPVITKMKMPAAHGGKMHGQQLNGTFRRRKMDDNGFIHWPEQNGPAIDKMELEYPAQEESKPYKHRTLDSLFASIKEQREVASQSMVNVQIPGRAPMQGRFGRTNGSNGAPFFGRRRQFE